MRFLRFVAPVFQRGARDAGCYQALFNEVILYYDARTVIVLVAGSEQ